jgi:hypothetical protein
MYIKRGLGNGVTRFVAVLLAVLIVSVGFVNIVGIARAQGIFDADVYVKDVKGNNINGAKIFLNGNYIRDTYFEWTKWTYLAHIEGMEVDDTLTAKYDYTYKFDSTKPNEGHLHLESTQTITSTGIQKITITGSLEFDLVISFEFVPDSELLKTFVNRMRDASDYMWDITDSHIKFGQIQIHDNKNMWEEADIRVFTDVNSLRSQTPSDVPNSNVGGIDTSSGHMNILRDTHHTTIVHEFGHYGLFLYDEYEDGNDNDYPIPPGGPPGFMNSAILYSEMTNPNDYITFVPPSGYENTEQFVENNGESCWETVRREYKFDGTGWWPTWPSADWVDWVEVPTVADPGPIENVGADMMLELHSSTKFEIEEGTRERSLYLPGEEAKVSEATLR